MGYTHLRHTTLFSKPTLSRDVRLTALALGGFWLLDGLLQLQPYMFSHAFEVTVVQSGVEGLPRPLYAYVLTAVLASLVPLSKTLNEVFAALELGVGALMMTPKKALLVAGCTLSTVWSALIWVIGEGMGGITSLTVVHLNLRYPESLVTGFPGAALLYALISLFLLLSIRRGFLSEALRITGVALFGVGGLLQLLPEFWDPRVQFAIFSSSALMGDAPRLLAPYILQVAYYAASRPILANTLEILASTALAALLALRVPAKVVITVAAAWLGFIWVFAMGFMGLLNGVATDPGTPPLLFLLVLGASLGLRAEAKRRTHHGPR